MTPPAKSPFLIALEKEMAASRRNAFTDNYDFGSLGPEPASTEMPAWRRCVQECVASFRRLKDYYLAPERYFEGAAVSFENVHFLHNLLVDQASKDLVVKLCAYRALGHRKVKLPRNTPDFWPQYAQVEALRTNAEPLSVKFMDATLALYDCRPLGYEMTAYATTPGLVCALVQKQYEFSESVYHYACRAEPGDVVIDAGGCWGETSLYFADRAGPEGRVVAFEFIPSNLAVFQKNMAANPELSHRVTLMNQPIWSQSGLKMYYVDWGPGSRVTEDENLYEYDGQCETITIDDAVARLGLDRVDFIKMDIEGAELKALHGAEKTIRAHRPKLAISIYHKMSDFTTIPRWLYSLGLVYDFFLDHHTIYENETVLFAIPRDRVKA
jgi:FkbM family methyltransferase